MRHAILPTLLTSLVWPAFCQPADNPAKFQAADVHVSPKATNPFPFIRTGPVRAGRYEIKTANMVDLLHIASGFGNDKILGGPSWLELDRFDVIAKVPSGTTPDDLGPMLQSLLEERFKLVSHKETKPLPTFALTAGKKPQLKEAAGTEETGCKPDEGPSAPGQGGGRLMMNMNGVVTTLTLGPGGTVTFHCRNITMASFTENLRTMIGADLGTNPLIDETGLKGRWNFDVSWTLGMISFGPNADTGGRISVFDAVDKQLGLKLEKREVPTPVLVVESVNRIPIANPPGTADILPPTPAPTEFDVASVKPTDPNPSGGRGMMMGFGFQPGGRFTAHGMPLRTFVMRAFNANNSDTVTGLPAWVDTERYDVDAKAPAEIAAASGPMDPEVTAVLLRSLLKDRFKMTYHTEDAQVQAYSLVAAKPKMKKADPNSRTSCKNPSPPPGSPPGTRVMSCQNITMSLFADYLRNQSPDLIWPVLDTTEIEGGWDFTLTWTQNFAFAVGRGGGPAIAMGGVAGGVAGGVGGDGASDPSGGQSLFEAIEKQLGLKLEKQKRTVSVYVVDHIEKPTEN